MFESRVELAPDLKDHWGIPSLRISGHRHPHDVEVGKFIAAKCEEWLKEAGAVSTWKSVAGRGVSGGQHQAGTCRMGSDPKTSVVDRNCRIHDLDNVYVVEEGDTLFDIARYELGKASRWADIYNLNRDVLGKDYNYLTPGMQLVLPGSVDPQTTYDVFVVGAGCGQANDAHLVFYRSVPRS